MSQREFPRFDDSSAPVAARDALLASKRAFGAVPEPLARYASSPLMLSLAMAGLEAFDKSSLAPLEREVLAMTMGHRNGCKFCLLLHRRMLLTQQAPRQVVSELEAGVALTEPRLEALRRFVLALLDERGDVSPQTWRELREAGYSHQQALDVVAGVSVYTLTTLANRLVEV